MLAAPSVYIAYLSDENDENQLQFALKLLKRSVAFRNLIVRLRVFAFVSNVKFQNQIARH